jgi:hypothetical protein
MQVAASIPDELDEDAVVPDAPDPEAPPAEPATNVKSPTMFAHAAKLANAPAHTKASAAEVDLIAGLGPSGARYHGVQDAR